MPGPIVDSLPVDAELQSNKRIAIDFLEHVFGYGVAEAMALLAPQATWWVIGRSKRLKVSGEKDRAQIERVLRALGRAMPGGMQISIQFVTAEANRVAVAMEGNGTWVNGRAFRNTYHWLLQFKGGLIANVHEYMDTLHLWEMLED